MARWRAWEHSPRPPPPLPFPLPWPLGGLIVIYTCHYHLNSEPLSSPLFFLFKNICEIIKYYVDSDLYVALSHCVRRTGLDKSTEDVKTAEVSEDVFTKESPEDVKTAEDVKTKTAEID